jgi:hypothetical protein
MNGFGIRGTVFIVEVVCFWLWSLLVLLFLSGVLLPVCLVSSSSACCGGFLFSAAVWLVCCGGTVCFCLFFLFASAFCFWFWLR